MCALVAGSTYFSSPSPPHALVWPVQTNETALMLASSFGHLRVVTSLLAAGADVDAVRGEVNVL